MKQTTGNASIGASGRPTFRRGRRRRARSGRRPWEDLAAVDYFAGLPTATLRVASRNADWCDVPGGTRLQRQGRRTSWLWIPVTGPLELWQDDVLVGRVAPGSATGEAELLLGAGAPVDVVAPADTTVVSLPARAFHGLLGDASFAAVVARRQARTAAESPRPWRGIHLVPA